MKPWQRRNDGLWGGVEILLLLALKTFRQQFLRHLNFIWIFRESPTNNWMQREAWRFKESTYDTRELIGFGWPIRIAKRIVVRNPKVYFEYLNTFLASISSKLLIPLPSPSLSSNNQQQNNWRTEVETNSPRTCFTYVRLLGFWGAPHVSLSFIRFYDLTAFLKSAIDISNYRSCSFERFPPLMRLFRLLVALSTTQWTLNLSISLCQPSEETFENCFHQHLLLIQRKICQIHGAKTLNSCLSTLSLSPPLFA